MHAEFTEMLQICSWMESMRQKPCLATGSDHIRIKVYGECEPLHGPKSCLPEFSFFIKKNKNTTILLILFIKKQRPKNYNLKKDYIL